MSADRRLEALKSDSLTEVIYMLAKEYYPRFGKALGITSEVGEFLTAGLSQLRCTQSNIDASLGATDSNGGLAGTVLKR